jgi:single-strand DNA-binding protein
MNDLNSVQIIGRLTGEPKFYVNTEDMQIIGFAIANNRNSKTKDIVSYINCKAFGKLADTIGKYCHKGDRVCITGRLQQNTWEKDGMKKSDIAIMVQEIQFLSGQKKGQKENQTDFDSLNNLNDMFT